MSDCRSRLLSGSFVIQIVTVVHSSGKGLTEDEQQELGGTAERQFLVVSFLFLVNCGGLGFVDSWICGWGRRGLGFLDSWICGWGSRRQLFVRGGLGFMDSWICGFVDGEAEDSFLSAEDCFCTFLSTEGHQEHLF